MLPTAADLHAYMVWDMPCCYVREMGRRKLLTLTPEERAAARQNADWYGPPGIVEVMSVAMQNGGPAPGLEHIWRIKGDKANRGDLFNYWNDVRLMDAKVEEVEKVASIENGNLAILTKLDELKALLESIDSHSLAGSEISLPTNVSDSSADGAKTLAFVQACLDLAKTK